MSRPLWLPEGHGKNLVRRYSLYVIPAVAIAGLGAAGFVHELVATGIDIAVRYFGLDVAFHPPTGLSFGIVFGFVWLGVFSVNYLMRDTTAMQVHEIPVDNEFPDPGYKERLKRLCHELTDELNRIDEETNWSHWWFVPLDAEVEIRSGARLTRRIDNLFNAIRAHPHHRLS